MIIEKTKVWLIMTKDKKLVAKGEVRRRELIKTSVIDKKRYLTYSSKAKAEAGFKNNGFFGQEQIEGYERGDDLSNFLEAVECEMTLNAL